MGEVMSEEQIVKLRDRCHGVRLHWSTREGFGEVPARTVLDSHEELRRQRDEARSCVDLEREDMVNVLDHLADVGQARDAAIARAEKAEMDRDQLRTDLALARRTPPDFDAFGVVAPCRGCGWIEGERKRATAAEAREAGMRGALMSCKNIACDSLTEPEKEEHISEIVDAALAAHAKGKGEKQ